jgi:hypothetical protein
MKREGFDNTFENINMDEMLDKTFHTFRRSKASFDEDKYHKWNPWNLVNKHYTRHGNHMMDIIQDSKIPQKIFHSKPHLVLNIGNEYITFQLMEELAKFYKTSAMDMPKRHLLTRFVKDLKEFSLKYVDYCHYTVPINQANSNGFVFPGEYMGQYGVYDAVKHVYSSNERLKHLLHDDYLLTNKRFFATEMEQAVGGIR